MALPIQDEATAASPIKALATSVESEDLIRIIEKAVPAIIAIFTPKGFCTYVSHRWSDYTGTELPPGVEQSFIHPDDIAVAKQAWIHARDTGHVLQAELRLRRHDGVFRRHLVRASAERNSQNQVGRWVVVAIDVEELKQAWADSALTHAGLNHANKDLDPTLADRTNELQEANQQLEAFAHTIAHDMRAPLRAMHEYAEAVTENFGGRIPAEAQGFLAKIVTASSKLDLMIQEVLAYTRVSQGRLLMQPTNLERILSATLDMHPQLNSPNLELSVRLPLHPVIGDATALMQVFSNLLTNAVKFMPADRKPIVTVWTEQQGDKVRICVKDNGIGIPAKDRERIFKMFERLQPKWKYEGNGIGLTIVRRAVERMRGVLGVDSTEGQGSTFRVELKGGSARN